MSFTRKRIYAALGAVLIVAGAGGYTALRGHGDSAINEAKAAAHSPTATEVDVAAVVSKTITDWQSYSGRLEAVDPSTFVRSFPARSSRCISRTASS